MDRVAWVEEKEKREKESLAKHARLSKLFRENRIAFERERRKIIDDLINSAKDDTLRSKLRTMQDSWDRTMKGACSRHNRFVLAQAIFWKHFYEVWKPTIEKIGSLK